MQYWFNLGLFNLEFTSRVMPDGGEIDFLLVKINAYFQGLSNRAEVTFARFDLCEIWPLRDLLEGLLWTHGLIVNLNLLGQDFGAMSGAMSPRWWDSSRTLAALLNLNHGTHLERTLISFVTFPFSLPSPFLSQLETNGFSACMKMEMLHVAS